MVTRLMPEPFNKITSQNYFKIFFQKYTDENKMVPHWPFFPIKKMVLLHCALDFCEGYAKQEINLMWPKLILFTGFAKLQFEYITTKLQF